MKCTDCNRPIKPVIALDIDGTLGDYHGHFIAFACAWLGRALPSEPFTGGVDLASYLSIPKNLYRTIKLAYRQGGMKRSMPAFEGAQALVDRLYRDGVEVWITTTRPYLRLDNVDPDTREWLRREQIRFDGLIYDEYKYDRLVEIVGQERVAAVLEDLPDKYDRAQELGLRPVFRCTQYNRDIPRWPSVATLAQAIPLLHERVIDWRLRYDPAHSPPDERTVGQRTDR